MKARINQIADSVATMIWDDRNHLPLTINAAIAAPVHYEHTELQSGIVVFVYPVETTQTWDTREDCMYDYRIGVTVTGLLVAMTPEELDDLQYLSQQVSAFLRDREADGADFINVNDDGPQPEFVLVQEREGQYYVQTNQINYMEIR